MKTIWKNRIITSIMVVAIVLTCVPIQNTCAAGMTAQQLQRKFPTGSYWNHVVQEGHDITKLHDLGTCNNPDGYTWHSCTIHWWEQFFPQEIGFTDCNTFGGSIQCRGFSNKLAYDAYGSSFYEWQWEYMKTTNIKPGDIIWYYTTSASTVGHQAMIIDVDGTNICLGECNWYTDCYISWGRWFDLNTVEKWTIYSAPYELPGGGYENIITAKKGDVDNNQEYDLTDSVKILKASLGIIEMDGPTEWSADLDGDGVVSITDANFSLKLALGIEYIIDFSTLIY